ncbi:hypothetical protein J1605_007964, partial [Eschrichtius robustus]
VLKDLKVQLDSLDQKALLDHLERMACQDTLGNVERLGFKARPALLGQGVLLDHRVTQVLKVSQGKTDQQDYVVSQVKEDFLELRAHQENVAQQEQLAQLVCQGDQDRRVLLVQLERKVLL